MSLNLNQNCKNRLIQKLIDVLPEIIIENNMFIVNSSTYKLFSADIILPQREKIKSELENYIGDSPFYEFVISYLNNQLSSNQDYDSNASTKKLIDLEPYKNLEEVANNLVYEFNSLPWEYTISFKLENEFGKLFSESIKDFKLSESAVILTPDDKFTLEYPLKDKDGKVATSLASSNALLSLLLPTNIEWDKSSTYLNFIVQGYINQYGTTATYESSILLLKAFIGLGLSYKLFKINYKYHSVPFKMRALVNKKSDDNWIFERDFNLDSNISEKIIDLSTYEFDKSEEGRKKKISWTLFALNEISFVFANSDKTKKIVSASQWYFESFLSGNELLAFIQSTIAVEILLGNKAITDLIGLGELMGNRCAYLIGESASQRERILKKFKEIYRIRSRIVHSGERKLNYYERSLFNDLKWMCRRIIREEVDLMRKDEEDK